MELEFDKEIDAILRKARGGDGAAVTAVTSPHLDVDTIAAFAENALPQKAKMLYIEHFADCDRCRRMLSQSVMLNSEAVTADVGAASIAATETAEATIPWFTRIFKTPSLALAMGAVVLAFSGILGYLAIQNRQETSAPEVSKAVEQTPTQGGPFYGGEADYSANSAATANKPTGVMSANTAANTAMPAANSTSNAPMRPEAATPAGTLLGRTEEESRKDDDEKESKPVTLPPPAPVGGAPAATAGEALKVEDKSKLDDRGLIAAERTKSADDVMTRDSSPAAAKKTTGPTRSGPANNQVQLQTQNVFNENLARSVNGKTFDRRDGVWYDIAYRNQATTNVKRGTDAYKKLDSGLRSIADNLGGTVVVIWKDKAYRIQ
jgi:hypothetical protein